MPRNPLIAVTDILNEIAFLDELTSSMTFDEFEASSQGVRSAAYSIQTISEATRHLPEEWLEQYPEQPWQQIRAIGNKIRHEYYRLSDAVLWDVITHNVPSLKVVLLDMQENNRA